MDKQELMLQIRRKKLGLLIADARLAARRPEEECAHVMGVGLEMYRSFENGENSPSLPQLESLAFFLNIAMPHFWGKTSLSEEGIWDEEKIKQRQETRNQLIGQRLRELREQEGILPGALAEQANIPEETLLDYEEGQQSIPMPLLESLCTTLQTDINVFFTKEGFIADWRLEKEALQVYKEMPQSLLEFVSKPVNYPYLELALRLSEMPAEKLRSIAESLLEITY